MDILGSIQKEGKIPVYKKDDLIRDAAVNYGRNKPSARILKSKIGQKALALLELCERNHNHNFYTEVYNRVISNDKMDSVAIFYRGTKITYRELFNKSDMVAKTFLALGLKQGDKIACCLSKTPELIYFMFAANRLGIILDQTNKDFDHEFLKERCSKCNKKVMLVSDDNYDSIKGIIDELNFERIAMPSLADSLPSDAKKCDEYVPELDSYYHYDNLSKIYEKSSERIYTFGKFLKLGESYSGEIPNVGNLDTVVSTTYTGGSTRIGHPKPVEHRNRNYVIGGIYNDTNLTKSPKVENIRGVAFLPPSSPTLYSTCIVDNLIKLGEVAMEIEYSPDTFLDTLIINSPVHADATTSFILKATKQYLKKEKVYSAAALKRLRRLLVLMAVGEKAQPGEEKLINIFLKRVAAGSEISLNGIKLPYAPLSIGGGDSEHSGIFYTLLKRLQHLKSISKLGKSDYGLKPVPYAIVTALKRENDSFVECDYNEPGIIVANSPVTMAGYEGNPEATKNKIITDIAGRQWVSCDVYGYINNAGNVIINGRVEDNIVLEESKIIIPTYIVEDLVCLDTKNILSCCTVQNNQDEDIVINVEFSPLMKKSGIDTLVSAYRRVIKYYPNLINHIRIRVISDSCPFPLTSSGKRSIQKLKNLGFQDTIKFVLDDNTMEVIGFKSATIPNEPKKHTLKKMDAA